MTLSEATELYLSFVAPDVEPSTVADYRSNVRVWERYSNGAALMPIRDLRAADFAEFKAHALEEHRPASLNKYLRTYRAVLRYCHAEGYLERVPILRPVPEPEQIRWRPSREELSRLYRACSAASWPRRPCGPATWWRTYLVLAYVGALRVSDVRALKWSDVTADGIESRRKKRDRLTLVPGLPCVRRHLRMLGNPGDPFILSCPNGPRQFAAAVEAIGDAAGMTWGTHSIKRAATDAWFEADESGTAGHIISHARQSVTIRSYLDRRKYLLRFAERLPIPSAFNAVVERQGLLF